MTTIATTTRRPHARSSEYLTLNDSSPNGMIEDRSRGAENRLAGSFMMLSAGEGPMNHNPFAAVS